MDTTTSRVRPRRDNLRRLRNRLRGIGVDTALGVALGERLAHVRRRVEHRRQEGPLAAPRGSRTIHALRAPWAPIDSRLTGSAFDGTRMQVSDERPILNMKPRNQFHKELVKLLEDHGCTYFIAAEGQRHVFHNRQVLTDKTFVDVCDSVARFRSEEVATIL